MSAALASVPLALRRDERARLRVTIRGAVQGVGFRPFVFRLATELGLAGWVNNSSQGVVIEVEGDRGDVEQFLLRIEFEKPPRSFIQSLESSHLDPAGYREFEIRKSDAGGAKTVLVLPDIAICDDCLREIFDPRNRRYRYPFTNCTNCGPRFSIIESLPYDRPGTSMNAFVMCEQCKAEYENPRDRRFHAQPNACPACGPHVELWDALGTRLSGHREAVSEAAKTIRERAIVAVKGLGGFHLLVDARRENAVRRLCELKQREGKPLALMFPSLESIAEQCEISDLEKRLLCSPEAPIVLLRRKQMSSIAESVAPGNPYLGAMLPYTPLHHLLMAELGFPVVATSGNLSDEPICTDEYDAFKRLGKIADLFLVHNRLIVRHVDDSIVRVMAGREMILRRARGFAPLPIHLRKSAPTILAVGAHLKNSIALAVGEQVFVSQHIGDLETAPALSAFRLVIRDFEKLYDAQPGVIAADAHPDYLSTKFARESGGPVASVQHHYAHALSCMAENEIELPVLGIVWDGTGYGFDGAIWGGEFLRINEAGFERVAHFRSFRLPGGDSAVCEPRRTAIGLLHEIFGDAVFEMDGSPQRAFSKPELRTLRTMLSRNLNCTRTSSAGRLFDAVAAIAGLRQHARFEGQAAMELEFALEDFATDDAYEVRLNAGRKSPLIADWQPTIESVLADVKAARSASEIAAKFHNALVETIVAAALRVGETRVALSGGCFQNKYLTERAVKRLREEGFNPYWHQRVPPNDGGISLGQVVAAARALSTKEATCA